MRRSGFVSFHAVELGPALGGRAPRGLSFPRGRALGKVLDSSGPQFPCREDGRLGRKALRALPDVNVVCGAACPRLRQLRSVLHCP